jgi:hypothetical protein
MKNMVKPSMVAISLVFMVSLQADAQYWGERVLEKGFEQTDFFFTPTYVMPYGIGSFKATTTGLVNDPLQEVIINPSRLGLDSTQDVWLYSDFRGAKTVKEQNNYVVPLYATAYDAVYSSSLYRYPYPRLYFESRRELEPVFSGGAVFRPLPGLAPTFYMGGTYQYILQDSKYYAVPQNIYRTAAGYDFNGKEVAASSSIPIVDKYSGKDDMHQLGHFGSVFLRYSPVAALDLGAKVSRATFHRDGAYGSANYWDYSASSSSLWSNIEMRAQSHASWDLCGGLTYHVNSRLALGATVGNLWGDAVQSLRTVDSSHYDYSSTNYTSYYTRSSNGLYLWNHQGRTWYYGGDIQAFPSPNVALNVCYRHQTSNVDIGLASGVLDTSFSTYSNTTPEQQYSGLSQSGLTDIRSGGGTQNTTIDRFMGALRWRIDDRLTLSVGVQVERYASDIHTVESVESRNRYNYISTGSSSYSWLSAQDESKDLLWTFTCRRTSFQIPVFLSIRASQVLEFLLAINRDMSTWSIDDMTLALFRYRYLNQGGSATQETSFGERYTSPSEDVSDIRTAFLAGLNVSPSEKLKFRLLVVPNFSEDTDGQELHQWQIWLGITVTP